MRRHEHVGELEIAERLGVKEDTVHKWGKRGLLPAPDDIISGRFPIWHWETIERWARRTKRLP